MLPRPSAAHRWLNCPASEALPHHGEPTSDKARFGTAVHAYLKAVAEVGREEALARRAGYTPMTHSFCSAIDLSALPIDPAKFSSEVRLGWRPDTGETFVGDAESSTVEPRLLWFIGTADVLAVDRESRLGYVADYKTGDGWVQPPADNEQLLSYGAILARHYDLLAVDLEIYRLKDDGRVYVDRARVDRTMLEAHLCRCAEAFDLIEEDRETVKAGIPPDTNQGDWCRFCPAWLTCPAKTALAASVGAVAVRPGFTLDLTTPEAVGRAYDLCCRAEDIIGRAKEQAKQAAEQMGGVPTPDGRTLGPVDREVRVLDGVTTYRVLTELYGPEVAAEAVEVKASLTKLKKACGSKDRLTEALVRLNEAGAMTQRTDHLVTVHGKRQQAQIEEGEE